MTPEEVLILVLRGQEPGDGAMDPSQMNPGKSLVNTGWFDGKKADLLKGFETGEYKVVSVRG